METDGPLKILFQSCAQLLLPLTGDDGAIVRRAEPAEIRALHRRADCVLELEKHGETYYRHLEFQDAPNAAMARRCFEYNTQLVLQLEAPVLTTVIYIEPPMPKEPLVFRIGLGGREINRWAFEQVCLWQMDAWQSLRSFRALAPLTPLMHGGWHIDVVEEALRRIPEAFPPDRISIAEEVLLHLARQHYTVPSLSRLVGRDRMARLRAYTEALAEGEVRGEARGEAKGRLQAGRKLCTALALKHHPLVFEEIKPYIEACTDPEKLEAWGLSASDLSDAEFVELVRRASLGL